GKTERQPVAGLRREFKKFYSGLFWIWNISPKLIATFDFWKWKEPVQWGSGYREQTFGLFFWLYLYTRISERL
ncbi:hypothetical protein Q0M53_13800, partial [Staphylococcus aureus]|nr:hypothetical protein [Staphylococcus aureus]